MKPNTSQRYTLAETLAFVWRAMRSELFTAMPGEIIEYDEATRRAKVRGSLKLVMDDGSAMSRAQIHDVPVAWPQVGGYILRMELQEGDPVLLVFAQRDLSEWKKEHAEAEPGPDGLLSEKDAVAIPGFGPGPNGDPLVPVGKASMQSFDGTYAVAIDADAETVTVKAEDSTAVFDRENIQIDAPEQITIDSNTSPGHPYRVTINRNGIHLQAGLFTEMAISPGSMIGGLRALDGTEIAAIHIDSSATRLTHGNQSFIDITSGTLTIQSGAVFINGTRWSTHTHGGVEPGAGNTGGVT